MVKRITTLRIATGMTGIGLALAMTGALSGCINVSAPDKPIQINLNISVTQEVVLRLDSEAKALIEKQPGIF